MPNRKTRRARDEAQLVMAAKLLSVAMCLAIAMIAVSGVLTWVGWMPAWVPGTHWVAVVGGLLGVLAVWAIVAAARVWRKR
jgi:hypothetical protein